MCTKENDTKEHVRTIYEGERLSFFFLRICASDMSASNLLLASCSSSTYTQTDRQTDRQTHTQPRYMSVCSLLFEFQLLHPHADTETDRQHTDRDTNDMYLCSWSFAAPPPVCALVCVCMYVGIN
jgi:hypothetical protein